MIFYIQDCYAFLFTDYMCIEGLFLDIKYKSDRKKNTKISFQMRSFTSSKNEDMKIITEK
jgi:hypothetical protein